MSVCLRDWGGKGSPIVAWECDDTLRLGWGRRLSRGRTCGNSRGRSPAHPVSKGTANRRSRPVTEQVDSLVAVIAGPSPAPPPVEGPPENEHDAQRDEEVDYEMLRRHRNPLANRARPPSGSVLPSRKKWSSVDSTAHRETNRPSRSSGTGWGRGRAALRTGSRSSRMRMHARPGMCCQVGTFRVLAGCAIDGLPYELGADVLASSIRRACDGCC